MKTKLFVILLTCSFLSLNIKAQNENENGFMQHVDIGIKASTYGVGADVNLSILSQLKARVGFNYFGTSVPYNSSFDIEPLDGSRREITIDDLKISLPNANLLLDFYPVKGGIFSLTGGLYLGRNKVSTVAAIDNGTPFEFNVNETKVKGTPKNNTISGDFVMGSALKPYLGIGFGQIMPGKRFGVKLDLGVIYQGAITIQSDDFDKSFAITDLTKKAAAGSDEEKLGQILQLTNFWPMLSLSVSYRLF